MSSSDRVAEVVGPRNPRAATIWDRIALVPWWRKVFHVFFGLYSITVVLSVERPWPLYQAVAWLIVWFLIEFWRQSDRRFNRLFFRTFRLFVRRQERRRPVGNTWFAAAAVFVTACVRDPTLAAACFVGWTFGDPTAEVFGRTIMSPRVGIGRKTLAGLAACFTVSLATYLLFFLLIKGGVWWKLSLVGAAATTLAEIWSDRIDDNLTIPVACALAFLLFS
ncbi:MAG: hypothetical protein V1907_03885 [Candidatus Kerfeldbacteria bacterium]